MNPLGSPVAKAVLNQNQRPAGRGMRTVLHGVLARLYPWVPFTTAYIARCLDGHVGAHGRRQG